MPTKFHTTAFIAFSLHVMVFGQDPPLPPVPTLAPPLPVLEKTSAKPNRVSLGVSVIKPGAALYAQLPDVPTGSGFLLKAVTPGGAAASAGLQPMDLIWKLGDQILINESQMMVLLSHRRPGETVKVSYYRSGMAKQAELKLQSRGALSTPPDGSEMIAMASQIPTLPMRVISYEDRSASISDHTGTATLTYREGKLWLHVESSQGEETFNDFVSEPTQVAQVPVVWRSRLPVLQRSLEESIRMRRLPRVRHVPRVMSKQRFAGSE